jgi:hypothetical protein
MLLLNLHDVASIPYTVTLPASSLNVAFFSSGKAAKVPENSLDAIARGLFGLCHRGNSSCTLSSPPSDSIRRLTASALSLYVCAPICSAIFAIPASFLCTVYTGFSRTLVMVGPSLGVAEEAFLIDSQCLILCAICVRHSLHTQGRAKIKSDLLILQMKILAEVSKRCIKRQL